MMRPTIIAGNWKMNTTLGEGLALAGSLSVEIAGLELAHRRVIIIPPFLHLAEVSILCRPIHNVFAGAQNCHFEESGAYTGEISPNMLLDIGVKYVLVGHSERRQYFGEDDVMLNKKLLASIKVGLHPILCVGETLEQRDSGAANETIAKQLKGALRGVTSNPRRELVIAYEPVWAIGSGKTASPEQAQEMHAFIRSELSSLLSAPCAMATPILYGGSVKASNANKLLSQPDIDGALVGGASLVVDDFVSIIKAGI